MSTNCGSRKRRGAALLAVLWLSAALAAIAFSLATTVRGETERASTFADSLRARYLASGAIDWAILTLVYGPRAGVYPPRFDFSFPTGQAVVEVIPETARLSLNTGMPEEYIRLLEALGADPALAQEITGGIMDWRGPGGGLDGVYSAMTPSFHARHASFEEVEEALLVNGMTPALFHGNYGRDQQGRLTRLGAFKDCVSVFGSTRQFDFNGAEPALLVSLGVPRESLPALLDLRREGRIQNSGDVAALGPLVGSAQGKLRAGGNTIFTLRATARLTRPNGGFSEVRSTVAAQIKVFRNGDGPPYQVLRWDEHATTEASLWQ